LVVVGDDVDWGAAVSAAAGVVGHSDHC
jgi:hypothetical protein